MRITRKTSKKNNDKASNGRKGYRGDWTEDEVGFILDNKVWVLKEMPERRGQADIKSMILCEAQEYEETINNLRNSVQD